MRVYLVTTFLLYVTVSCVNGQGQDCPAAWSGKPNDPTSPCYLITNKIQRSWQTARQFCQYMGGDLVQFNSQDEMTYIYQLLGWYTRRYHHNVWWIGIHDNVMQTGQQWVDSSVVTQSFLTWYPGEPGQYDRMKGCVEYYNGTLRHESCSSNQFFICERPRASTVWCDSRRNWETIKGKCYKAVTRLLSWDDSRAECQKENGDLVVVEDEKTQTILYNYIESRRADMWIGLRANKDVYQYSFKWNGLSNKNLDTLHAYWLPSVTTQIALNTVIGSNGSQSCVLANHTNAAALANWQMATCNVKAFGLCSKAEGRCASGWIQSGSMCYQVYKTKKTFTDAGAYCNSLGGNLITIRSAATQTFVNGLLSNLRAQAINVMWIGLGDNAMNKWTWANNIPLDTSPSYSNLNGSTLVDHPGLDCVNIFTGTPGGVWQQASNCSAAQQFICEIALGKSPVVPTVAPPAGGTTAVITTAAPWSSVCGPYWVLDPTSNYCFKFSDDAQTWFQAEKLCESEGGRLASIANFQEQNFIGDRIFGYKSPALWLGLNSLQARRGFHFIDGQGLGFLNWAPGEPNNVRNNEHCAEIITGGDNTAKWNDIDCTAQRGYICKKPSACEPNNVRNNEHCAEFITGGDNTGKWNDVNCDARRGYICKKPSASMTAKPLPVSPVVPPNMVYGCPSSAWMPYFGSCFLVNTSSYNWDQARAACQAAGGDLASIVSENEQNFIYSFLPPVTGYRERFWIGLTDRGLQNKFRWTDNSTVSYTLWDRNEPNNWQDRPEDCVCMMKFATNNQYGEWNDYPCDRHVDGFICRTPRKLVPSSTPQYNPATGCTVAGSVAFGYKCYKLLKSSFNWNTAKSSCGNGGNLVVVQDAFQQAFLSSQITYSGQKYWIGLANNSQTSNVLKWVTGAAITYTAWSANHTGNEQNTCVAMGSTVPGVGLWENHGCTETLGALCEYPRSGFSTQFMSTTTTLVPPTCPSGWNDHNGYCYKGYSGTSTQKNWFEARDACRQMGADLLSIHSDSEQSYATSYPVIYSQSIWLGYNDFDIEKGYLWSDGSPDDYSNWDQGEPNDGDGSDDCVEWNSYNKKWNDNSCYLVKDYVCKIPKIGNHFRTPRPTQPSTASPLCSGTPNWYLFNTSCYYVSLPKFGSGARKTWYDARDYCLQNGGDLASIHSADETHFLETLVTRLVGDASWIGFNDLGVDKFRWIDGSPVDYTHWSGGEPNDAFGAEKCGQVAQWNGHWNDNNCNDLFHFVCKRPQGGVTPATVPQTTTSPGGCPKGFHPVTNSNKCLTIYGGTITSERKNFTDALKACRALGSGYDIASINSVSESATMVTQFMSGVQDFSGVWIGMNDINNNNRWTWVNNQRLLYTNWGKGQPQRGGKCVEMYSDMRHAGQWFNIDCSNTRAYACEAPRSPNNAVQVMGVCNMDPSLTGYFDNPASFDCYHVEVTPLSWQDAQQRCQAKGTSLVSILNVYEQAFLDTFAKSTIPFWTGLADQQMTGTYTWREGFPVTYTSWNQNQPTYTPARPNCVFTQGGLWNDTSCDQKFQSICKRPAFPAPTPTPNPGGFCKNVTWTQIGNSCYYLQLNTRYSWATAESNCQGLGMELASVLTREDENAILQLIDRDTKPSASVWVGLHRVGGFFQWTDQSAIHYINWKSAPGRNDCVYMQDVDGKWMDSDCNQQRGYLCKAPKLAPTSPPPSTRPPPTSAPPAVTVPRQSSQSVPVPPRTNKPVPPVTFPSTKPPVTRPVPTGDGPAVTIPNPSNLQNQIQNQQQNGKGLSSGSVAGIIIGVALVLVVVCGILIFLKRRNPDVLFMFQRFGVTGNGGGDGSGFDNAAYQKESDTIAITADRRNGAQNGNVLVIEEDD